MSVTKTFEISIDTKRAVNGKKFELIEGDTGNIFHITVTDDGSPVNLSGCRVLAIFSKPTGTSSQDSGATDGGGITISGTNSNEITIALYASSFAATGLNECELQIYSGETLKTLITTSRFNFTCKRSIANADTLQSTDEYPLLTGLISQVNGLISDSQSDWEQSDADNGSYIKNKPTIPTSSADIGAAPATHTHADLAPVNHTHSDLATADHTHTPASIGAESQRLQFTNAVIAAADFVQETTPTYSDYPYRAAVALTGVLETMPPEVVFGVTEATSGSFAPVADSYDGGIYVYASEAPSTAITIPTIIVWKAVIA